MRHKELRTAADRVATKIEKNLLDPGREIVGIVTRISRLKLPEVEHGLLLRTFCTIEKGLPESPTAFAETLVVLQRFEMLLKSVAGK